MVKKGSIYISLFYYIIPVKLGWYNPLYTANDVFGPLVTAPITRVSLSQQNSKALVFKSQELGKRNTCWSTQKYRHLCNGPVTQPPMAHKTNSCMSCSRTISKTTRNCTHKKKKHPPAFIAKFPASLPYPHLNYSFTVFSEQHLSRFIGIAGIFSSLTFLTCRCSHGGFRNSSHDFRAPGRKHREGNRQGNPPLSRKRFV